jgi:RND family efflux transporter MFP subunit
MRPIFRDFVVPLVVLGMGIGVTSYLFKTGPAEAEADIEATPTPVEVVSVETVTQIAKIHTTGRVEPDREVTVLPQVTGRLVSLSVDLVPGGRFSEGAEMGRIDSEEYQMGLVTERSRVTQAELEHALETERGSAAEREWELVKPGESTENTLALREPHLDAAQSAVDSAKAGVQRARLNIDRTKIQAPFNSVVVQESAEIGQLVGPSTPIATLVGTDHFRVRAAIPVEQLSLFELPGARALVTQEVGAERIERTGTVERLSSQLDPSSQTAQIWIKIADPLDPPDGQLPLLAGSFVSVTIDGTEQQVRAVPRSALYEARYAWVVGEDDKLYKTEMEIAWSDDEQVYVTDGVAEGDQLVISPLSTPMSGMAVEVIDR